jgi:hypothetical protein
MKIRDLAKRNGIISHFPIGPSGAGRTATATNGVKRTAPGAPIFATPTKNGKAGNGLPTPSRTTSRTSITSSKSRKRTAASDSEEAELTDDSDFDDFSEDTTAFFNTPNKASNKMRLREVLPKKYAVQGDDELGSARSDDSDDDFNPNADHEEEERKTGRRRGIMDDLSD